MLCSRCNKKPLEIKNLCRRCYHIEWRARTPGYKKPTPKTKKSQWRKRTIEKYGRGIFNELLDILDNRMSLAELGREKGFSLEYARQLLKKYRDLKKI